MTARQANKMRIGHFLIALHKGKVNRLGAVRNKTMARMLQQIFQQGNGVRLGSMKSRTKAYSQKACLNRGAGGKLFYPGEPVASKSIIDMACP